MMELDKKRQNWQHYSFNLEIESATAEQLVVVLAAFLEHYIT